jgi:cyclic pyranopterin phosphate synthase
MGAKKTPELIPLCHPIAISSVDVDIKVVEDGVAIVATVKIADRTGVEMEALTAVSIAALTIIDMVKALDPGASIVNVRVDEKDGGRNGHWKRP